MIGNANRKYFRFLGTKNIKFPVQQLQDSVKFTVFCAMSKNKVWSPFFLHEKSVSESSFLDILSLRLMPRLRSIATTLFSNWMVHHHTGYVNKLSRSRSSLPMLKFRHQHATDPIATIKLWFNTMWSFSLELRKWYLIYPSCSYWSTGVETVYHIHYHSTFLT